MLTIILKNEKHGYGGLLLDVWRHVGGCGSIGGFADLLTSLLIKVEEKEIGSEQLEYQETFRRQGNR